MAQRENSGKSPDQVDRQGQHRKAQVLADQCDGVGRHVRGGRWLGAKVQHGKSDGTAQYEHQSQRRCAIEGHASAARPLSGNIPRGRRWMNRISITNTAIFPSTAPATGSRNLLRMPSVRAPITVPHRLPTPPNTTTMKLSIM